MPDPAASTTAETTLWKGSTSQWTHFWFYFLCILLAGGIIAGTVLSGITLLAVALVIPAILVLGRWWATRCRIYELTTERFRVTQGILNRRQDELELFRVKDYAVEQPFTLRLLGLGNITIVTADATTPTVEIRAVGAVYDIRDQLRRAVDLARDRKRVRQMDLDTLDSGAAGDVHDGGGHHG